MISSIGYEAQHNFGNEYDAAHLNELKAFLLDRGAKKIESWSGHGGSQEIEQVLYSYQGEKILLEVETYEGITLFGNAIVIKQFSKELG